MDSKLTKGQRTKLKLLEATARCISKIGIEKTSFTEIAKEAKVKRPLVAYHFPKKDDIFYRVILYISERLTHMVLKDRKGVKGREGIVKTMSDYIDFFQNNKHYFHSFFHLFYMASIQERYRFLNTKMANRVMNRLSYDIEQMLLQECGGVQNAIIESFAQDIYKNFIGSLILYHSTYFETSQEVFKNKWFATLDIQLDLVIEYQKEKLKG